MGRRAARRGYAVGGLRLCRGRAWRRLGLYRGDGARRHRAGGNAADVVSSLGTWKFYRAGYFRWRLFWPFALVSIPMAYLGGAITLPGSAYKILVGVVLLYAAWQLWLSGKRGAEMREVHEPPLVWAMLIGAAMGLLAGLTGVGGGIFLSPLLLMLGWASTKQTSAVAAPFILVNSLAGLAAVFVSKSAALPAYIWILVPAVLIGGWLGAEYGSRRFANPLVRRLLAVVLALAGAKMVFV
jgi:uncharacterized protein